MNTIVNFVLGVLQRRVFNSPQIFIVQRTRPRNALFKRCDVQQGERDAFQNEQMIFLCPGRVSALQNARHILTMWNYRKLERKFALSILKAMHGKIGPSFHCTRLCPVGRSRPVSVRLCEKRQERGSGAVKTIRAAI